MRGNLMINKINKLNDFSYLFAFLKHYIFNLFFPSLRIACSFLQFMFQIKSHNSEKSSCTYFLSHSQLFVTPWTVAPLSEGILQARMLKWVAMTSSFSAIKMFIPIPLVHVVLFYLHYRKCH